LDGGRDTIYVWHGAVAGYSAMALCTRICKKYIAAIQALSVPVANSSAPPSTEYTLRLPETPIKVVHIRSGQETEDFIWNFIVWNSDFMTSQKEDEIHQPIEVDFTPSKIPDNEEEDENIGEDGRVKVIVEKPKYSSTVEYKRNKETSTKSSLEPQKIAGGDIKSIKLKHTANGSTTVEASDDISDISDDLDENNPQDDRSVLTWIKSWFSGDSNEADDEEPMLQHDNALATPTASNKGLFCSLGCFL
jgi:hypothetical protein